ncbi:hypothetical protein [Fluviicola sp.]|uniref:hypothetical protein n=1 Tax=Fluviicola sp. TaxID=1917219 RepID=UPI0031D21590
MENKIKKNWFEDNPTKSIITYTLIIIGAAWAFYRFTFEENKLDLYKAQIESKKSEISQYMARIDFLEKENTRLNVILKDFEDWNSKSSDPGLFYKNKFKELALLKAKYEKSLALNNTVLNNTAHNSKNSKTSLDVDISKSSTYINDDLGIVIAVNDVNLYGDCNITISVGMKKNETFKDVKVGRQFSYDKISITLSEAQYIGSYAKFHISVN